MCYECDSMPGTKQGLTKWQLWLIIPNPTEFRCEEDHRHPQMFCDRIDKKSL